MFDRHRAMEEMFLMAKTGLGYPVRVFDEDEVIDDPDKISYADAYSIVKDVEQAIYTRHEEEQDAIRERSDQIAEKIIALAEKTLSRRMLKLSEERQVDVVDAYLLDEPDTNTTFGLGAVRLYVRNHKFMYYSHLMCPRNLEADELKIRTKAFIRLGREYRKCEEEKRISEGKCEQEATEAVAIVRKIFESCTTYPELRMKWPSGAKFYEPYAKKQAKEYKKKSVPEVRLNEILGL